MLNHAGLQPKFHFHKSKFPQISALYPDEPAKNPAKRVGTGNSRGESISIYKKVQAIKQYESLVKEHGKKIGSQKFYELKLPGLFAQIVRIDRKSVV